MALQYPVSYPLNNKADKFCGEVIERRLKASSSSAPEGIEVLDKLITHYGREKH